MKFCHNHLKQLFLQGLPFTGKGYFKQMPSHGKLAQPLAWSLPLISILASAPTALAQVNVSLDWDTVDFPVTGSEIYTDVGGSGVDVQISVTGAVTGNGNPNLNLGDSGFVTTTPFTAGDPPVTPGAVETLLVGIEGGSEAVVTIEFFETGTTTPVDVDLASIPLFDVDLLFNSNNVVSWQDEVEVSASSGGVAADITTSDGAGANEGSFNAETAGADSVTLIGFNTIDDPGIPAAPSVNANSPRQPLRTTPTTIGEFQQGNATVNFPGEVDTITIVFRDGPATPTGSGNFHAIAIGDISFTANLTPATPSIGIAKEIDGVPTETATPGIFELTYNLTIANTGSEALNTVQIVEDFIDPITGGPTFGPGNIISSTIGTVIPTGGAIIETNDAYNVAATGVANANVLVAANSSLPVGASATIPITIQVDTTQPDFPPDGGDGYNNQATVTAIGESGTPAPPDDSDNGTEPDPNGNGDPTEDGENDPTPASFAFAPAIGLAKQVASPPTPAATPGFFNITYLLTVENLGNEQLDEVQIVEDFIDPLTALPTFGPGNITVSNIGTITNNGGGTLTLNPDYNATATGTANSDVLATGGSLPIGASATIPIVIQVDTTQLDFPDDTAGDGFNNQATASGTGANSGEGVEDESDDGTEPDSDGNGSADDPGEDDPTPVTFETEPAVGIAKQIADGPTETTTPGIFELTYNLTIENTGTEALDAVQIDEPFFDPITNGPTFGPDNIVSSTIGTVIPSGGAVIETNDNYNVSATGPTDTSVLVEASSSLPLGASATIPITIQVDITQPDFPADGGDGYNNQATVTGTGESGNPAPPDLSDDGTEPDPNNNGDPTEDGENDPTPASFDLTPAIGVSKRVISATTQPDGDFEVVYETTVENLGQVTLTDVQLVEDLDDTYGEGAFQIISTPDFTPRGTVDEVELEVNDNFDGDAPNGIPGDTNIILPTGQTLQPGQNSTFQFTVEIDNDLIVTPDEFENQIEASGLPPGATTDAERVRDLSDDGVETDENPNDGQPGNGPNEDDPTVVALPPTPVIGSAKQTVSALVESAGTFGTNTARITYDIIVANIGNVPLLEVQLEEDLSEVFGPADTFEVVSITRIGGANTVQVDPGFDGVNGGNTTLLADVAGTATGTLAVGASSTLQLVVDVDFSSPNLITPVPGPYLNQVIATATDDPNDPPGTPPVTSDPSDSGMDVDPDGDGNPNEDNGVDPDPENPENDGNENTPTQVTFTPDLRLVKRITRVTRNGTELAIANIGLFNDQASDTNDNALATLSGDNFPLGRADITDVSLQSGDLVEYTVYFFNAGVGVAENVEMCDELQVPSVLQPTSLQLAQPTDGSTLNFSNIGPLSARAPLSPLEPSCETAPGTFPSGVPSGGLGVGAGGGVVVGGPESGLNVNSGEVGAFRFEIEIP